MGTVHLSYSFTIDLPHLLTVRQMNRPLVFPLVLSLVLFILSFYIISVLLTMHLLILISPENLLPFMQGIGGHLRDKI